MYEMYFRALMVALGELLYDALPLFSGKVHRRELRLEETRVSGQQTGPGAFTGDARWERIVLTSRGIVAKLWIVIYDGVNEWDEPLIRDIVEQDVLLIPREFLDQPIDRLENYLRAAINVAEAILPTVHPCWPTECFISQPSRHPLALHPDCHSVYQFENALIAKVRLGRHL